MIFLAAVLAALAATAWALSAAWLHGTFAPDPGIHRPIRNPGPIGRCTIALTHTQPIPTEVRRQVLAGPKENR